MVGNTVVGLRFKVFCLRHKRWIRENGQVEEDGYTVTWRRHHGRHALLTKGLMLASLFSRSLNDLYYISPSVILAQNPWNCQLPKICFSCLAILFSLAFLHVFSLIQITGRSKCGRGRKWIVRDEPRSWTIQLFISHQT